MPHVHFSEEPYYKVLSASTDELGDPEWITNNLFLGQPTSEHNDRCLEALRLRRLVEEIKGGGENMRISRVANRLTLVNVILTLVIAFSTLVNVVLNWR